MKKWIAITMGVAISVSACAFTACGKTSGDEGTSVVETIQDVDNIILVIGDGMGENHILNAIEYFDLDIPVFMEDQKGYIRTDSIGSVTDSAAAGTALATGKKVINGNIAQFGGQDLTQITTLAKEAGKKTGVVTTDTLCGATPAAFSAHAPNRDMVDEIVATQLESDVDLFIGQSHESYLENKSSFEEKGYAFASSVTELENAKESEKLVAVLPEVGSEYIVGNEEDYQLKEMAKFAVEYLQNDNGFFLMIEGAYIDKYSHNNDLRGAMCEVRSLFNTISYLYGYAEDGNTAILITADHETGGLYKIKEGDIFSNSLYTSTGHTGTNVPVFTKNCRFDITEFGYGTSAIPQNTVVFDVCKSLLK